MTIISQNRAIGKTLAIPLFFLFLSFFIHGWHYGRAADIMLVKYYLDPSLFTNDLYVQTTSPAYAFFHRLVAGTIAFLHLSGSLETVFLGFYCLFGYFTLLAAYLIAKKILKNSLAAGLFVFFFILNFRPINLGPQSFWLSELRPQLDPNFAAKSFQLISLLFLISHHLLPAFTLGGLALDFHPLSSIYLAIILALWSIINLRALGAKKFAFCWLSFFVVSLPVLLSIFFSDRVNFLTDRKAFLAARYLTRGLTTFLYFPLSSLIYSIVIFFFSLLAIIKLKIKQRKTLLIIYSAVASMLLAAWLLADIFQHPAGLIFSFLRASFFLDFFGLMTINGYLVRRWENPRSRLLVILIFFSLFFSLYRLFFLLAILAIIMETTPSIPFLRPIAGKKPALFYIFSGFILLIGFSLFSSAFFSSVFSAISKEKPRIGDRAPEIPYLNSWQEVQRWSNTIPKDSLFLLLTDMPQFNTYSERASINFGETIGNLIFSEKYRRVYLSQMEDLGFDFLQMNEENNLERQLETVYSSIKEDKVREFAEKYSVDYVVAKRDRFSNLFPVFQNEDFSVYRLP